MTEDERDVVEEEESVRRLMWRVGDGEERRTWATSARDDMAG